MNSRLQRNGRRWPVEVTILKHEVTRVRIYDERDDICSADLKPRPDGIPVMPLTPTAFAEENPPKWGFIFAINQACGEFAGTSMDVYYVIESAWRTNHSVLLTFDTQNLIIVATL